MCHIEAIFHKILHILRAFNVFKRLRGRGVCVCVCVCERERERERLIMSTPSWVHPEILDVVSEAN